MEKEELLRKLKRAWENETAALDSYNQWPTPENNNYYHAHQKYRMTVEQKLNTITKVDVKSKQAERYTPEPEEEPW